MNGQKKTDSQGEQFIELLRNAGIEADYRRIEEMLWLSRLLPVAETEEIEAEPPPPDETGKVQTDTRTSTSGGAKPKSKDIAAKPPAPARKPAASREQVYSNLGATGDEGAPASKVRVPSPAALPDSLEMMRALRSFRRRVPSRHRFELDEEETVARTAERGVLTPAYLPIRERWFDAMLVVEDKSSMAIWLQPLAEFQRVLERVSAFREVRTMRLAVTEDRACLLTPAGQEQPLNTIADPYGRRLIFLITDGVSAAWQDGRMAKALAAWGRIQPVVIVQMLSERMWHLTPLGKPSAEVRAHNPGAANRNMEIQRLWESEESDRVLPLPVVVLHPASLGRWTQAVLTGSVKAPAVVLHETGDEAFETNELEASLQDLSAEELVSRFQYLASPTAFQLAVYLSSVPLQIPIMRLVQRVMLPESRLEHLSEFLLGGLVERADNESNEGIEEVDFAFRRDAEGNSVQTLLQREIRKGEMERLYHSVSQYIEERYGQPFDFFALVADQKGSLRVPSEALPFTEAAAPLLRRFGITPRDGRRFNLPDPAEDLSDLEQYLTVMEDEFAHGRKVFQLFGTAGSGKTELALTFAHRVKRQFPAAHYFLDLGGSGGNPLTTESALTALIQAFRPDAELPTSKQELHQLYQDIMRDERALLILDDAGERLETELLLPGPYSLCLITSRHSQIVTVAALITLQNPQSKTEIIHGPYPNDPWKAAFGGVSERNHRRLSAQVQPVQDSLELFSLRLEVTPTDPQNHPLRDDVQFFLHHTFDEDRPIASPRGDGKFAAYQTLSWGAFTVGALTDNGETRLELDLAQQTDIPYEFRHPLRELVERAVTLNLDLAEDELPEFEAYARALDEALRGNLPAETFQALSQLGTAFADLGHIEFADELLERMRLLAKKFRNRDAEIAAMARLALLAEQQGQAARAIAFAEEALAHLDERTSTQFLLSGLHQLLGRLKPEQTSKDKPLKIFISYSHRDEKLCDELVNHLRPMERTGLISIWLDREQLRPSSVWADEITKALDEADIILFLVSYGFLSSEFLIEEMRRALKRYEKAEATIIPIILSDCDWGQTPLFNFQALPRSAKPVTEWKDRGEAFADITRGIRQVVERLQEKVESEVTVQFEEYDCFISYDQTDRAFAQKLYESLQWRGIHCWLDEKPSFPDDKTAEKSKQHIRSYDKFLLCISEATLKSNWVEEEIKAAERREKKMGQQVLIPLLLNDRPGRKRRGPSWLNWLDDFLTSGSDVSRLLKDTEAIDFRDWNRDDVAFRRQLSALLNKLKIFRLTPFTFDTVTLDAGGKVTERRRLQANQFVEELESGVTLEMVEIPGGNFMMGSYGSNSEYPPHKVTVPAFYMGKFQVTQAQWRVVAGWPQVIRELKPEPSYFPKNKRRDKGDEDRPVEQVSWEEAVEFCARMSAKTGRDYRLPSEAEWEYACRAGTDTPFAFGETITPEFVNYNGNYSYGKAPKGEYRKETVPVGNLGVANAFGLYDMHGNVWEWCEDVWHQNYQKAPDNGSAWLSGGDSNYRVLRGGSWNSGGHGCRSAIRDDYVLPGNHVNNIGFRVVVSAGLDNTRHLNT